MKIPTATRPKPSPRYDVRGSRRTRCPRRTRKIGARKMKEEMRLITGGVSRQGRRGKQL
jgi:hypothetical protein